MLIVAYKLQQNEIFEQNLHLKSSFNNQDLLSLVFFRVNLKQFEFFLNISLNFIDLFLMIV